jgi:hypothetical protein
MFIVQMPWDTVLFYFFMVGIAAPVVDASSLVRSRIVVLV